LRLGTRHPTEARVGRTGGLQGSKKRFKAPDKGGREPETARGGKEGPTQGGGCEKRST